MSNPNRKDKPYRATFVTHDGAYVGLDFYASNQGLAQDHAFTVGNGGTTRPDFASGPLTVVRVRKLVHGDEYDPGTFYRATKDGEKAKHVYVAVGPNYWGKGFSVQQAMRSLLDEAGSASGRAAVRKTHVVYAVTDPWAYVDDMGRLVHSRSAQAWEVTRKGVK